MRTEQKRRKKLNVQYIQKIYTFSKDKTTSEMGSKRIAAIINKDLENEKRKFIFLQFVVI